MFNAINTGLRVLGTLYLWQFPVGTIKSQLRPLFKSIPETETSPFGAFDPGFDSCVKEIFNNLLTNYHLQDKVRVFQNFTGTISGASTTFKGKAIVMLQDLLSTDAEAFRFAFKHELSHIKDHDTITRAFLVSAVSVFSMYYLRHSCGLSFIPTGVSYFVITGIFKKTLGIRFEWKADNFAINNATADELKGALRLFEAEKLESENSKSPFLDFLLGMMSTHPHRIRTYCIHRALEKRGVRYDPSSEEIEDLTALLKRNQKESMKKHLAKITEGMPQTVADWQKKKE